VRRGFLKLVFDASPLIAFFREIEGGGIPGLLANNGYHCIVPEGVRGEIIKEPAKGALLKSIQADEITVVSLEDMASMTKLQTRYTGLGRGESEVLILTQHYEERGELAMCIMDETPARKVADRLGLKKVGTIGLLRMMAKEGIITVSEMDELIRQLGDSSFRVPQRLCDSRG
jgi:predicted nucleic acid-binding protein